MGLLTSIELFNEQNKNWKKLPLKELDTQHITLENLLSVLEKAFDKQTTYQFNRLSESCFEIEERSEGFHKVVYDNYLIETHNGNTRIRSQYFTNSLLFVLAPYALKKHKVWIEYEGKHPFYIPETYPKGQVKGNYHYVTLEPLKDLHDYVKTIFKNFKGCEDYWNLSLFIDEFGYIEINN